jgi:hypothetical protein
MECEYKVIRTFGPKTEEVTGGWRRLQHEELHMSDITRVNTSMGTRCAGHVERVGEIRTALIIGKFGGGYGLGRILG